MALSISEKRLATTTSDISIRASIGDYQGFPLKANVTVFWGFDKDGHMTDIWVWKMWDSLLAHIKYESLMRSTMHRLPKAQHMLRVNTLVICSL